ncbi:MAG: VCBS repeat-containing protein [Planctomycetes bacterium]|nr:VCBS repeat-containing protein [Planctomycetota bacterium]
MRTVPWILLALAACHSDESTDALVTDVPLRARSIGDGPRFAKLDPATTGLEFQNLLERRHNLPYLYNGAGLAVGDYDDDGLPDIYLVSQDGPNKLFRQTSPLRFEDVTESAGGLDGGAAWGTMATFADVDDDGDLDLYVCNLEAPNLLYQNRGDGTFVECAGKLGLGFVGACTTAAFADYDNDGDLDLYLLTNRILGAMLPAELIADITPPADTRLTIEGIVEKDATCRVRYGEFTFLGGQPDRLIRNDGYARWVDVTEASGIHDAGMGLSATWWDFDDDGFLDLYVANDLESPDVLWRNRGDGTFEDVSERALPHTAYYGMGSDFGDLDNDGRFDFCVADMSSRTHYMSKMLMGNMGDRRWFLENARPPQYMRNAVYLNTGADRFLEAAYLTGLASTDWTWTVRFADLDNDGRLDLFATNGIPRFDNDPDAQPEFRRLWELGERERALDFARNLPPVRETNLAFRNLGDYHFEEVGTAWGIAEQSVSQGAVLTDLDRDGDLDVVINNMNAPASVYENRTADANALVLRLQGERDNSFGVGARIEVAAGGRIHARQVVLARGYLSGNEAIVHIGIGAAERADSVRVVWPSGQCQDAGSLAAGALHTIRQDPEVRTLSEPAPPTQPLFDRLEVRGARHQERDFDDYAVQPLLPHRHSRMGPGVAIAADGTTVMTGAAGQPSVRLQPGPKGLDRATELPDPAEAEQLGALWFDYDSDGDEDLYLVAGGVEHGDDPIRLQDHLLRNDGDGRFVDVSVSVLPKSSAEGHGPVAAADFDRDGDLDLFVGGRVTAGRYPEAPPSRLLRNDDGVFEDVTDRLAPGLLTAGLVTSAIWSDVDADGFVDLLVTAHWEPVRLFANQGGQRLVDRTAAVGLAEHLGLWNGIAAGDFDRDGDIDFAVTNLGWNSKYKASTDHPMEIYAADFDQNGTFDIVEAKHSGDRHLPVRGRSCSSQAMPFIASKFRTFDSFARATLDEIYTPAALAKARLCRATTLASSLLVNHGSAGFEVRELPRLAQIAPGFGIVAVDLDGDGWLDLAIAQNSYSPEPETGRMDGGVSAILRGTGPMEFHVIGPAESGILLASDTKSLAVADHDADGRPDLLFGINDEGLALFENRSDAARFLAVRLRGTAGNPSGIGARLTLRAGDAAPHVREIHAGGSYLAQSTAAAFFALPVGVSTRLEIRWPDGSATTHEIDGADRVVTISR